MSKLVIHFLCEGQTEGRFVISVLKPYFERFGTECRYEQLNPTSGGAGGGRISVDLIHRDLNKLIKHKDNAQEVHRYTTMYDLYKFHIDFPEEYKKKTPYDKAKYIESKIADHYGEILIPYIQVHEFEALLFVYLKKIEEVIPNKYLENSLKILKGALRDAQNNPEFINGGETTSPAKRIAAVLNKAGVKYSKPAIAMHFFKNADVEELKKACTHFRAWINSLEELARKFDDNNK